MVCFNNLLPRDKDTFKSNSGSSILNKNERVLMLKKVFSLEGNSDEYQFKDPIRFDIGEDGSIFIMDRNRALYKFSEEGIFQKNLLIKGEGPGELKRLFRFFIDNNRVILFDHFPNKIVEKDFKGKFINNFSIPERKLKVVILLGIESGLFFFSIAEDGNIPKKLSKEYREFSRKIFFHTWKNGEKNIKKGESFYIDHSRWKRKQKYIIGGTSPLNAFEISNVKNGSAYFINSFDYKIKKLDVHDLKIKNEFGRPYVRVKYFHPPEYLEEMRREKKSVEDPEKKHFQAVQKLINRGTEVWAVTSTFKKDKGILVDVFSPDGTYMDKFYLPLPEITSSHLPEFNIVDNKIVILGKDEDENHIINIYEIVDL